MKAKRNFTLIELLVVIAIIAILAGMLLPALNSARDRGRSGACMNQVKQIMSAFNMYTLDNNDYMPVYYVGWKSRADWIYAMTMYLLDTKDYSDAEKLRTIDMLHANRLFMCPSLLDGFKPSDEGDPGASAEQDKPFANYTINGRIGQGSTQHKKATAQKYSSSLIIVSDTLQKAAVHDGLRKFFVATFESSTANIYREMGIGACKIHAAGHSTGYLDGHVGTLKGTQIQDMEKAIVFGL